MPHDVTELNRLEAELEHLASFLRLSPNPVLELDAAGNVIFCNRAAEEVLQKMACSDSANPFIPENLPEILQALKEKRTAQFIQDIEIDGLFLTRTIKVVPQLNVVHIYATDISKRKRAEEEVRTSREHFRSLFFNMAEGVALHELVYDDRGIAVNYRVVDINPSYEQILHLRLPEIVGRLATEVYGVSVPPYLAEFIGVATGRTARRMETYFPPMDRHFEISIVPWGSGGFATIFTDVTERKQAEEKIEKLNTNLAARAIELENANRELEAFNYSVSHDLRKPLTIINGYCQIILDECGLNLTAQCREYLQEIRGGTQRMNQLIDALLKFSSFARTELHAGIVDLSTIANSLAAELALTEPGRRVTFRIAAGITTKGDQNLLRVVLENLLGNAWKYTSKRAEAVIEFGTMEAEGMTIYFVRDNGAGFDMTNADKLFIAFQRLPGTDEFKGHGIGLATVERIVRRHGGKVWAEGEKGKGATFYFTL